MPQGASAKNQGLDLLDETYDGLHEQNLLIQGLGQLTDGIWGHDDFRSDVNGYGKGIYFIFSSYLFYLKLVIFLMHYSDDTVKYNAFNSKTSHLPYFIDMKLPLMFCLSLQRILEYLYAPSTICKVQREFPASPYFIDVIVKIPQIMVHFSQGSIHCISPI